MAEDRPRGEARRAGERMRQSAGRRPGGPARNCSRSDGIRAGMVTGPWRSGSPERSSPVTGAGEPAAAPIVGVAQPAAAGTGPTAKPGARRARTGLALGAALLAAGVAVIAWTVPGPMPGAAPAVAVSGLPERVVLRMLGTVDADVLAARLAQAGVADVALSPLAFGTARTRVGFYHDEDRAAAEALAALLADPEGAVPPLRDYGALVPRPPRGTIDLWIAG